MLSAIAAILFLFAPHSVGKPVQLAAVRSHDVSGYLSADARGGQGHLHGKIVFFDQVNEKQFVVDCVEGDICTYDLGKDIYLIVYAYRNWADLDIYGGGKGGIYFYYERNRESIIYKDGDHKFCLRKNGTQIESCYAEIYYYKYN